MENPPTLSVIVPVRNLVKTIGELMESLISLDYDSDKLEIVVVDVTLRMAPRKSWRNTRLASWMRRGGASGSPLTGSSSR